MRAPLQVVITGVGGQGIILATRILAEVARLAGVPVIGAENHGMSQRGGSVESHLKAGAFRGPTVRDGAADVLLAFDRVEGLRALHYLREGGTCVVNADQDPWPAAVRSVLEAGGIATHAVPADRAATGLGTPRSANVLLIGATAAVPGAPWTLEELRAGLRAACSPGSLEKNLRALDAGAGGARGLR